MPPETSAIAIENGVGVIELDNQPVNGLGHDLRLHIAAGLEAARVDSAIKAVVLIGAGKFFSGGADIREFNTPKMHAAPMVRDLIVMIEEFAKPVIAAIHGVAMGGGFELALGCHYRVALADAKVALPEVKLGLMPGAGGTQRLPRAIGVERAAEMIVTGQPVKAADLGSTGLFAAVIEGDDLRAGAVRFAANIGETNERPRLRDATIDCSNAAQFFTGMRAKLEKSARGFEAPLENLGAVEAAVTMAFDAGMKFERERFIHLMEGTQSKAQRHAFFAERQCAKIPGIGKDITPRAISGAAVIGCGTMGGGIAMCFANAGIPVTVLEQKQEALDNGLKVIRGNYERSAKRGRMTAADVETRLGLITPALSYDALKVADIVIEAAFEDMAVKRTVFEALDECMKPGTILATNTSTLDVDKIAALTKRPGDVLGMHFFSPANVMRLLEVVRGKETSKEVVATAMALSKRLGKVGVLSGVCDGFIGNRMLEPYVRQAGLLLMEGASPTQVDGALETWGMAMGPFRMYDLAGNDVGYLIRKRRYEETPGIEKHYVVSDRIAEMKRFGQKTGAGWYCYEAGDRTAHPDPAVDELIETARRAAKITPREITDEEIIERCIFALVNEGAALLEEGIALRASDIDMVWLTGYGFPIYRGGPMFFADTVGLSDIANKMKTFSTNNYADPEFWTPAPLLAKLAAGSQTFDGG